MYGNSDKVWPMRQTCHCITHQDPGITPMQVMTCTHIDALAGSTLFFKCEIFQKR